MKNLLLFATILLLCQSVQSQSKKEKIEKLISAYSQLNRFNGSVLVSEKGKIIFEKSYGIKNFQTQEKNTNQSIYRIYSTTKSFTATTILLLNDMGKLSLQDKLTKYFPNFPKGDSITIEQLLTHTSGIQNNANPEDTKDEKTFINFIKAQPLDFSPGSQWNYSNSNYYLLGYIINKTAGMSYQKAIQKYILDPLKMTNTGFGFKELKNKNKTTGYEFLSKNNFREGIVYDYDHPHTAGAMYSTVEDLYKYEEGLKSYKILKKETLEKAQTPFHNYHYGYGWDMSPIKGKETVGHDGGGPGFVSRFFTIPQDNISIIILSNLRDDSLYSMTSKIVSIFYNLPYQIPTRINIDFNRLNQLKGIYNTSDSNFYISVNDGMLTLVDSDTRNKVFFPESDRKFYTEDNDGNKIRFEFESDKDGKVNLLKITSPDGKITEAEKTSDSFSWGITGSATPNGWGGPDIKLISENKNTNILKAQNILLKPGEIKFRSNNEWVIELGINGYGKLVEHGNNIKIANEGTYDVVLDMTDETNPTYQVIKK
ncbi:serine hydrolase [Chryseobacterium proteolyticum]|uniref:serine hydrolase n=1 Tax=Chryseobacterium proteolyticum TaxID=118127 RepID=UPI00398360F6